jgi:hypothetical protein
MLTNRLRALLALLLLSGVATSQTPPNKIDCPAGAMGAACRSFRDAVDDEDKHIVEAVRRRAHVVVCFRPTEDVFLLLSYDSPEQKLWHEQESRTGFQQPGTVEFTRFRNGNANFGGESLLAVGHWLTSSTDDDQPQQFSGGSLLPGDNGTIRIDADGVHISHTFKEKPVDPVTQYEFSMRSPTVGFVEKFTKIASPGEGQVETSGKCLNYK